MFEKKIEKKYEAESEISAPTQPYVNSIDGRKQEVAYRTAEVLL